uniref:NAD-dependent epimerase/dehydratase family protein n=1 Tax=Nonomuraea pusilla TaxID=46177 RepID=UPI0006E1E89A|nr:NAD-dependent epimerase/dehydratase family protein [Nonomuraea pusilla]
MKVLVLGATGYIGGVLLERLAERGHEVAAVVRPSADGSRRLPGVADERYGDLADGTALAAVTPEIDVIVHTANLTGDRETDLEAIAALTRTGKRLLYVSGVWVLGPSDGGDEESPVDPIPAVAYRPEIERLVLDAGGTVVRPGVVHGRGGGIAALLKAQAAQRGEGVYVSAGGAVPTWTFVHVDDLADLLVTAAEKGGAAVYHGISEEGVPVAEVAVAAARAAGAEPVARPWPLEEAAAVLGEGFAQALALGQRVGAARTRAALGWNPTRPGVVADLVEGSYA